MNHQHGDTCWRYAGTCPEYISAGGGNPSYKGDERSGVCLEKKHKLCATTEDIRKGGCNCICHKQKAEKYLKETGIDIQEYHKNQGYKLWWGDKA